MGEGGAETQDECADCNLEVEGVAASCVMVAEDRTEGHTRTRGAVGSQEAPWEDRGDKHKVVGVSHRGVLGGHSLT